MLGTLPTSFLENISGVRGCKHGCERLEIGNLSGATVPASISNFSLRKSTSTQLKSKAENVRRATRRTTGTPHPLCSEHSHTPHHHEQHVPSRAISQSGNVPQQQSYQPPQASSYNPYNPPPQAPGCAREQSYQPRAVSQQQSYQASAYNPYNPPPQAPSQTQTTQAKTYPDPYDFDRAPSYVPDEDPYADL
eukprot:gene11098-467_t